MGLLAIAALAGSAAGCSSLPSDGRATLASGASSGSTLAFESIDGPPPDVFRKLVANLNNEAGARQIAVVSRSGTATYRVRGYVSAQVERDKTTFAWVWDVYDTDKRRTLRIAGEEPAVASGRRRDAWAAADEQVLRRMAHDGMDRIAGFLNASEPAPAQPDPSFVTLVSGRDDSPEGAGIFRVFDNPDRPAADPAAPETTDTPKPAKKSGKSAANSAATKGTRSAANQAAALDSGTD
jgi:hypothetical protein